jgi:citrate synthase
LEAFVSETAEIKYGQHTLAVPVVTGTENEKGLDIGQLRAKTGLVTLDPAFMNTASTKSAITFIDGDQGILRYRGIPIEELAEKSTFVETAYLLINGHLPNKTELARWSNLLTRHSLIHEDMKRFFDGFPSTAHPMAQLSAMVCSLSSFYPETLDPDKKEHFEITAARLISKVRTLAAYAYKKSIGQPMIYPDNKLSYCSNFLRMMFAVPSEEYVIDPEIEKVMNLLFILHADHEQNCSTSTVRVVGSSRANLFASIAAGICALWGPLHGGANQEVLEMLEIIRKDGGDVNKFVGLAKDKNSNFRLMGFGHRVYKNFDPRAKIIKRRTRSSPSSTSTIRCSTSPSASKKPRSRTSTSCSESSTPTWTSTRGSSTARSGFRRTCSPCCSRSAACPAGSRTGAR